MLAGVGPMTATRDPGPRGNVVPLRTDREPRRWPCPGLPAEVLLAALLLAACSRPGARPRDGALPWLAGTPSERLAGEVPATLPPPIPQQPTATTTPRPTPTPLPAFAAIPARSPGPGIYPLITNLQPAPGAAVPPGDVVLGARVTGASNLVDVVAFVDGEVVEPLMGAAPGRTVVISFVRQLPVGLHEVRVEARDERGQTGSFRWFFSVGPRQPWPTITVPTMVPPPRAPTPGTADATPEPP